MHGSWCTGDSGDHRTIGTGRDLQSVRAGPTLVAVPAEKAPIRRVRALDGVRAIAILAVVAFHAGAPRFANGAAGVIVFFVLSGYLITTLLIQAPIDGRGLGLFYLRRFLRLFPALAVLLIVLTAFAFLALAAEERDRVLAEVVASGLYVQDFVLGSREHIEDWGYLGHTWSLAVEEQFYLVWPLVLMALAALRTSRRTMLIATVALTVVAVSWRCYLSWAGLANRVGAGLDGNAESLLVGCSLALVLAGARPERLRDVSADVVSAVAFLVLLVVFTGVVDLPLDTTRLLTALLTAVLIAGVVLRPGCRSTRALGWSPLAYVGLLSYGLYLWHPVVFRFFEDNVDLTTMAQKAAWAPVMLAVTAVFTVASYHLVEKPFNRLKDRLPGGRRLRSPTAPAAPELPADRTATAAAEARSTTSTATQWRAAPD